MCSTISHHSNTQVRKHSTSRMGYTLRITRVRNPDRGRSGEAERRKAALGWAGKHSDVSLANWSEFSHVGKEREGCNISYSRTFFIQMGAIPILRWNFFWLPLVPESLPWKGRLQELKPSLCQWQEAWPQRRQEAIWWSCNIMHTAKNMICDLVDSQHL